MTGFIGEYNCKLDVKGRLLIPSEMRKQLSPEDQGQFVVSRGVDDCLSLYTSSEWLQVMNRLRKLNRFKPKDRKFARMFQKGATKVMVDGSGRILIPKGRKWAPTSDVKSISIEKVEFLEIKLSLQRGLDFMDSGTK